MEIKTYFWKQVKSVQQETLSTVNGNLKNDETIWDETELKEIWKEYFRDLYGSDIDILRCGIGTNATEINIEERTDEKPYSKCCLNVDKWQACTSS